MAGLTDRDPAYAAGGMYAHFGAMAMVGRFRLTVAKPKFKACLVPALDTTM